MKIIFTLLLLMLACQNTGAQVFPVNIVKPSKGLDTINLSRASIKIIRLTQPYGVVDTADLKMTTCSFEKDANAMVLFDAGSINFTMYGNAMVRQRRIKILNEKGKEYANIKIEYHNLYGVDHIVALEAHTINLINGKIVITKVDSSLFYNQHTDKSKDAVVFSFPNVIPGSVLEYRYVLAHNVASNFPAWYFQNDIPTRYSQFSAFIDPNLKFTSLTKTTKPFLIDSSLNRGHIWAMNNIAASKSEYYMRAPEDGLESIALQLSQINIFDKITQVNESWSATGKQLANNKDYYKQLDQNLSDEDKLIKTAAALKTDDEKIAFIFNAVKTTISWNNIENWASSDGIKLAWKKKSGNSAEINAILYHLLKKCGVKAYPMLVSTRKNGLLNPNFVNIFQINSLVTYVPVDSTKYYILDASDKYNSYNEVPYTLLNSYGLYLNKEKDKYDMVFIESKTPATEHVFITAEIGTDGTMKGKGQIVSYTYNKTIKAGLYKTQEEKKFEEVLTNNNNSIKISNLKSEGMDVDTLPLKQNFDFTYDLNNSDNYLLFSPNLFTQYHDNPFLSETRSSSIDFGFNNNVIINGSIKFPVGYKIESLPKNGAIVLTDKSIRFSRLLQEDNGSIGFRYEIRINRSRFTNSEYPDIHLFFKRMFEMLNEQIVLKKS